MSDHVSALTPHVCRNCLGRVLLRAGIDGECHVRCADCGLEAPGEPEAICMCGALPAGAVTPHCAQNPDRSPDAPSEIVAVPVERVAPKAAMLKAIHGDAGWVLPQ